MLFKKRYRIVTTIGWCGKDLVPVYEVEVFGGFLPWWRVDVMNELFWDGLYYSEHKAAEHMELRGRYK